MTGRPKKTPSQGRSGIAKWRSNTPTLPPPPFPHFFAAFIGASARIISREQRSHWEPWKRTLGQTNLRADVDARPATVRTAMPEWAASPTPEALMIVAAC
jgi:hypothetical protein